MPHDDASEMLSPAIPGRTRFDAIVRIQREICECFGVRPIEMLSQRRARSVARPRQIAMYLSRELTPHSLPVIGRHFGGRDHTTVMHACQVVKRLVSQDRDFAAVVAELRQRLADPSQPTLPQVTSMQVIAAQYAAVERPGRGAVS